jgi:hypothetical protein
MPLIFPPGILLLFIRTSTKYAICTSWRTPVVTCSVRTSRESDWSLAHIQIFTDTLESLAQMCEEAENDQPMLPIAQMGLMMVDWLDPQKVV